VLNFRHAKAPRSATRSERDAASLARLMLAHAAKRRTKATGTRTADLPSAIVRAQAELEEARTNFVSARLALLKAIKRGQVASFEQAVEQVSTETLVDPGTVQQALWALVHERAVQLGDHFDVSAVVH
jgi:hypothetical protein